MSNPSELLTEEDFKSMAEPNERPPEELYDLIYDMVDESGKATLTTHEDGYTWIIEPEMSQSWVVIIQWYVGDDDYSVVNINGNFLTELNTILDRSNNSLYS